MPSSEEEMEVAKGAEWCGGRFEETPFRKDREVEKSRSREVNRGRGRTAGPQDRRTGASSGSSKKGCLSYCRSGSKW